MGGIFGIIDANQRDAATTIAELDEAAGAVTFRGRPSVISQPPAAFGAFSLEHEPDAIVQRDGQLLATHAAVYEPAADPTCPPAKILSDLLADGGVASLDAVSADFSLAVWDPVRETLTLARDALGLRPLFYASLRDRVAFASDPDLLFALGASRELEREGVTRYLLNRSPGRLTAFRDIRRVVGGHWIELRLGSSPRQGRWFRPEKTLERSRSLAEASEELDAALTTATAARARGARVGLLLSGGWDSGSVAATIGRLGLDSVCITQSYAVSDQPAELDEARDIARHSGLQLVIAPVPLRVEEDVLRRLPDWFGTPAGLPLFPVPLASMQAATQAGVTKVMTGDGGEMFAASPVAVWDLLRSRRFRDARTASRAFADQWVHPQGIQAKAAVRAIIPPALLRTRERFRPTPPWVRGPDPSPDGASLARSAREQLVMSLVEAGGDASFELQERLYAHAGIEWTAPLLDRRVIEVALSLPVDLRVPVPGPKPALARASLGSMGASRRKVSYVPYMRALARSLQRDFPRFFGRGTLAVRRGLLDADGLDSVSSERWEIASLALVPLEAWLTWRDDGERSDPSR